MTPEAAAVVVPSAWCAVKFPAYALGAEEWIDLFELAGYTVNGVPAPKPVDAVRLYRGSVPEHRRGWSWTEDRTLAQWFADRPCQQGRGRVWTVEAPAEAILARITEHRPGESEWVINWSQPPASTPPTHEGAVRCALEPPPVPRIGRRSTAG